MYLSQSLEFWYPETFSTFFLSHLRSQCCERPRTLISARTTARPLRLPHADGRKSSWLSHEAPSPHERHGAQYDQKPVPRIVDQVIRRVWRTSRPKCATETLPLAIQAQRLHACHLSSSGLQSIEAVLHHSCAQSWRGARADETLRII